MGWEKKSFVRDLRSGQPVADVFVLAEAKQGVASNGGPFWTLKLQDASGSVGAKIWSPQSQAYPDLTAGKIVFVEGKVSSYRDQVQINVDKLSEIDLETAMAGGDQAIDVSQLVPSSPDKPEIMLADLEALCRQHLKYPPWRCFVSKVLADPVIRPKLLVATAAKAMHHAYLGGLLEHTLAVARSCLAFSELYPALDREILLVAAVCHDLGKAWELSSGLACDYTDPGRLLGHIFIGLEVLEPFFHRAKLDPDLVMHFKHIVISHHGEYEYGSPRRPKTAEAMALHYADNLDAKMHQFAGVFKASSAPKLPEPDESEDSVQPEAFEPGWSAYQRSLERFLYRPRPTPATTPKTTPAKKAAKKETDQCLLPLKA